MVRLIADEFQIRVNFTATQKRHAQVLRSEEESVPRHGQKRRERF
jgi:hypothetical protein